MHVPPSSLLCEENFEKFQKMSTNTMMYNDTAKFGGYSSQL